MKMKATCDKRFVMPLINPSKIKTWTQNNMKKSPSRAVTKHMPEKSQFPKTCNDHLRTYQTYATSTDIEQNLNLRNGSTKEFEWFKHWWPVQAEDNLKTDRPNKITLLGNDYVVWKGHSGEWIAMDDQCPHRMAPLSEGRIEKDGNLLCSYHAWRFNECGKCVKIPHAESEAAHNVACNSRRSAIQIYPCKSRGGIIWIWPDRSETAQEESEVEGIPIDSEVAEYFEYRYKNGTFQPYVRTLCYGYDVLLENLCDPSHFTVSHHGLFPAISRYNAVPLESKMVDGLGEIPALAAMCHILYRNTDKVAQTEFVSPSSVIIYSPFEQTSYPDKLTFVGVCPIGPGKSKAILALAQKRGTEKVAKDNPVKITLAKSFGWLAHAYIQNRLFDGDSVFLNQQGKKIKKLGVDFNARKDYFVPSSADFLVLAFRKWFSEVGKSGAAYGNTLSENSRKELTRHELLDRYEQHTKHCKVCTDALKTIKLSISVFKTLSLAALAAAGILILQAASAPTVQWISLVKNIRLWISVVVCITCTLFHQYLQNSVVPTFYFEDHVHAEMD